MDYFLYCPYCGKEIVKNAKVCPHCGRLVSNDFEISESDEPSVGLGILGFFLPTISLIVALFLRRSPRKMHSIIVGIVVGTVAGVIISAVILGKMTDMIMQIINEGLPYLEGAPMIP